MPDQLFYRKKRSQRELSRKQESCKPYETVLIICEGIKTEINYFKNLCEEHKLGNVEITHIGSDPIHIVNEAIKRAEIKNGIEDRIYCVFDKDGRPTYEEARRKIEEYNRKPGSESNPKIDCIGSVPCFEIWVLLHFTYTAKPYNSKKGKKISDVLEEAIKPYFPEYEKSLTNLYSRLKDHLPDACKHAKRLKKDNVKTKSTNPSTDLHELVQFLENLKKQKPYS